MRQYVIDAFTDQVFKGNPAAVCVHNDVISDSLMLSIARENNLSETAFAIPQKEGYKLRWFTPGGEVDLCGHATLATAYVILKFYEPDAESVSFSTLSGKLTVRKCGELLEMEFPRYDMKPVVVTDAMEKAVGARPREAWMGRDLLCVFDDPEVVIQMSPDQEVIKTLEGLLLHVTAPGKENYDCVSRSFAPKLRIPEDPVCGSGHCHIVPYWAGRLKKNKILAYQASERGGTLYCRIESNRVFLSGRAALFAVSDILTEQV